MSAPILVQSSTAPVPTSPVSVFDVVFHVAHAVQAPWPLALNSTLAAATTAVQALIDVETPLGHVRPVSNFFVAIAESGSRKTAVDKMLSKPIKDRQDELQRRFRDEVMPAHQRALEVWEAKVNRLKRKHADRRCSDAEAEQVLADLNVLLAEKPQPPREPQFIYRDFTGPALMEGLAYKRRQALVSSSDASSVLNGHAFRQLADLNLMWDGDDHVVNRAGRESIRISEPRLTIDLAVQMAPYRDFLLKGDKARSTGFAARCLTCMPDSLMGSRFTNLSQSSDPRALEAFYQRVGDLLTLAEERMDAHGYVERTVVKFSEQAAWAWRDWVNQEIEPNLCEGGTFRSVSDQASKIGEIACRMAAVFAFFESGGEVITVPTFQMAKDLCMKYLFSFKALVEGQIERIQQGQLNSMLVAWLHQRFLQVVLSNFHNGRNDFVAIEKNHIRTYGPNALRNKATLTTTLEMLAHEGWIRIFHPVGLQNRTGSRTTVCPGPSMQFDLPNGTWIRLNS